MKKIISLLVVIVMMAALATVAFAADEITMTVDTVEPGTVTLENDVYGLEDEKQKLTVVANAGDVLENVAVVNVTLHNAVDVTLGEFVVNFHENLEMIGYNLNKNIMQYGAQKELVSGKTATFASGDYLNGEVVLLTLYLKVKEGTTPGSYPVSIDVAYIGDDFSDLIVDQTFKGAVVIPCGDNHAFGEWTQTKAPTCTEEGEETRTCSACGAVEKRAIAKLPHSYESVVTEPTCTEAGYTTYTCSVCGDSYIEEGAAALGHDYSVVVEGSAVAPTCTEAGKEADVKCSRCDAVQEGAAIDALGHDFSVVVEGSAVAPTCTEAGKEADVKCSRCDAVQEGAAIDALGHTWDEGEVTKEATCCDAGEITFTCTVCGEMKTEAIAATGNHDLEYVDNADGKTHNAVCKVSGKTIIEKEAHKYGDLIDDPNAPGWKYKECSLCHYIHKEESGETGDNTMIAVAMATVAMMGIAVVVSKKKEF